MRRRLEVGEFIRVDGEVHEVLAIDPDGKVHLESLSGTSWTAQMPPPDYAPEPDAMAPSDRLMGALGLAGTLKWIGIGVAAAAVVSIILVVLAIAWQDYVDIDPASGLMW